MTSLKTDLLEKLKKQEASIKLHQIQLIEEIELELEKKRRLEKDEQKLYGLSEYSVDHDFWIYF